MTTTADNPRVAMRRAMEQSGHRRRVVHQPAEMGAPAFEGVIATLDPGVYEEFDGEPYKTWDAYVRDDEVIVRDDQGVTKRTPRVGEHITIGISLRAEGFEHVRTLLGTVEDISRSTDTLVRPGRDVRAVPRADECVVTRSGEFLYLEEVWCREQGEASAGEVWRLEGLCLNADRTISAAWDVFRREAGR